MSTARELGKVPDSKKPENKINLPDFQSQEKKVGFGSLFEKSKRKALRSCALKPLQAERSVSGPLGLSPACKSAISQQACAADPERVFLQGFDEGKYPVYLKTYRGVTEIRMFRHSSKPPSDVVSKRSFIQGFSKKSRIRLIKKMLQAERIPDYWIDFTFEDSCFEGMDFNQVVKHCSSTVNRFRVSLGRKLKCHFIMKKEYEPRKSGVDKGKKRPHLHAFFWFGGSEKNFKKKVIMIMKLWVRATKTKNVEKALTVGLNPKSYRKIESEKMASVYCSKYVAKTEVHEGEKMGRFWFTNLPEGTCDLAILTRKEGKVLRRLLVRFCKWARKEYINSLKWAEGTFVIIGQETMWRMIEYVKRKERGEVCFA